MELCVRLPDDSVVPIVLSPQACIATLKTHIQMLAGIPAPIQLLSTQEGQLADQEKAGSCPYELTVRIDPQSDFAIRLLVKETSGVRFQVCARLNESVREVKTWIEQLRGVAVSEQRLYAEKKLLDDSQPVLEVYSPGVCEWELLLPGEFFLTVTDTHSHSVEVAVAASDRVSRVVKKLREEEGINCCGQVLTYKGKGIEDVMTLRILGIEGSGSIVCEAPGLWVWAAAFNIPSLKVHLNPSDSVLSCISSSVSERFSDFPLWILHRGRVLSPTATLQQLELASGAIIYYGDLLVHVRSFNIEKFEVVLSSNAFVGTLKRELMKRLNRNTFKLMYCGTELRENRTFRDCGFSSEVTIELIEPTDNYLWVETNDDKIALTTMKSVWEITQKLHLKTGSQFHEDRLIFNMKLINGWSTLNFENGGVLQVLKSINRRLLTILTSKDKHLISVDSNYSVGRLLLMLKPKFEAIGLEGFAKDQLVSSLPSKEMRLIEQSTRRLGFRLPEGNITFLPYSPSDLVSTLSTRLQKSSDKVHLLYCDSKLDENQPIENYRIEETEYIDVCRESELVFHIHSTNERLTVSLSLESQKVSDLYQKGRDIVSEPVQLFCCGWLAEDSTELRNTEITAGCCVHVITQSCYTAIIEMTPQPDKFVFIQRPNGEVFLLSFHHSHTLEALIETLKRSPGIVEFSLVLESRLLTKRRFCRIRNGSKLHLLAPSEAVLLRFGGGIVSAMLVAQFTPLPQIKECANIPPSYKLIQSQKQLEDDTIFGRFCFNGVVEVLEPYENLVEIKRLDGEKTFVHIDGSSILHSNFVSLIYSLELEDSLPLRLYLSSKSSQSDSYIYHNTNVLLLSPPQLLINVIHRKYKERQVYMADSDTIGALRRKVTEMIKTTEFHLVYQTLLLTDDSALMSDFDFISQNEVYALSTEEAAVVINGKKVISKIVNKSQELGELKSAYLAADGNEPITLFLNGKALRSSDTLDDHSITTSASLDVVKQSEKYVKLQKSDGKRWEQVMAKADITLSWLQTVIGRTVSSSLPVYWSGVLNESNALKDYKIQSGSTLFLSREQGAGDYEFFASVNRFETSQFPIKISQGCRVVDLSAKLQSVLRSKKPPKLVLEGVIADEEKPLKECGFLDGQMVDLLFPHEVLVTVSYDGVDTCFPISEMKTIQNLKRQVSAALDIPVEMQLIYKHGTLLEDNSVLITVAAGAQTLAFDLLLREGFVPVYTVNGVIAFPLSKLRVNGIDVKTSLLGSAKVRKCRYRLLQDNREIADSEVADFSDKAARVELLQENEVRINVQSLLLKFTLYKNRSDPITNVLRKLQAKVGVHSSLLRLIGQVEVTEEKDITIVRDSKDAVLSLMDSIDKSH